MTDLDPWLNTPCRHDDSPVTCVPCLNDACHETAVLAAQEGELADWYDTHDAITGEEISARGERGGAEVAALRLRAVHQLAREWDLTEFPDERTAMIMRADLARLLAAFPLADSAGALAKHDAEVLRAAAEEFDQDARQVNSSAWRNAYYNRALVLRDRADRIAAGGQP